jgi:hypothetical protein
MLADGRCTDERLGFEKDISLPFVELRKHHSTRSETSMVVAVSECMILIHIKRPEPSDSLYTATIDLKRTTD